jgi:hypothetical protein
MAGLLGVSVLVLALLCMYRRRRRRPQEMTQGRALSIMDNSSTSHAFEGGAAIGQIVRAVSGHRIVSPSSESNN